MESDLQSLGIDDGYWYDRAADKEQWRTLCLQCVDHQQECLQVAQVKSVFCPVCECYFRRESDRACHKCVIVRKQPVDQQPGAVQC